MRGLDFLDGIDSGHVMYTCLLALRVEECDSGPGRSEPHLSSDSALHRLQQEDRVKGKATFLIMCVYSSSLSVRDAFRQRWKKA